MAKPIPIEVGKMTRRLRERGLPVTARIKDALADIFRTFPTNYESTEHFIESQLDAKIESKSTD